LAHLVFWSRFVGPSWPAGGLSGGWRGPGGARNKLPEFFLDGALGCSRALGSIFGDA